LKDSSRESYNVAEVHWGVMHVTGGNIGFSSIRLSQIIQATSRDGTLGPGANFIKCMFLSGEKALQI